MGRMTNGTAHYHRSREHRGPNQVHVQEEHHLRDDWSRGTCAEHNNKVSNLHRDQNIIYAHISLTDSMERGLFKRGITRREYQICLLETRYPCKDRTNIAEPAKPVKRKYQNGGCFQARSVCRNKQTADESDSVDTIESKTKRLCLCDRPTTHDPLCSKVFQGVGSDLIAPWLTPMELYNVKRAFQCDWDWGQAWQGGNVKDKAVAAQVAVLLTRGRTIVHLIDTFGADEVFSALWYVLTCSEFIQATFQYGHLKSMRRLDRLRV